MFDALLTALVALASPDRLAYMALGVGIGYAIGVLPALGGLAGLSLVMPFIYGLDQVSALAMLVGLVVAMADIAMSEARGKRPQHTPRVRSDILAVIIGMVLYVIFLFGFHPYVLNVPVAG